MVADEEYLADEANILPDGVCIVELETNVEWTRPERADEFPSLQRLIATEELFRLHGDRAYVLKANGDIIELRKNETK